MATDTPVPDASSSAPSATRTYPRRGNWFSRLLGAAILRLLGWRVKGELPDLPRFFLIGAPHTSNRDFVLGMASMFYVGLRISWLGKHTIFRGPARPMMRWLGGIPLDRTKPQGMVAASIQLFQERDELVLGVAPEGTRSHVERWKLGFYHIAHGAQVPIVPIYFDNPNRTLGLGPPIYTTGDLNADLERIYAFYIDVLGVHPLLAQ